MKKKIAVGAFLVLATAFALGFAQLYPGASEAAEVECEGGDGEAIAPNETGYENITWINAEIEDLEKKSEMQIAEWVIIRKIKEVDIWVYKFTPENQQLNGTMIGGWKVNVWEKQKPPKNKVATDEETAWIRDQIERWKENPEMKIGGTSVDRSARKTATLWVSERTPENQQLHYKTINGWKIIVAEDQKPPLMDTIGRVAGFIGVVAVIAFILLLIYKKFQAGYRERREK